MDDTKKGIMAAVVTACLVLSSAAAISHVYEGGQPASQEVGNGETNHEIPPSQWNSPPLPTIMEGTNVEYADFVVFENEGGDYIYAKSGKTGEIVYSGSDDNRVISDVIDNTTSGGIVFFKNGTYSVTGCKVGTGVTLIGSGKAATHFVTESPWDYAFVLDNVRSVRMKSFTLRGSGFNITNITESVIINDVDIYDSENAIRIFDSLNVRAQEITIDNFGTHAICIMNDPTTAANTFRIDMNDVGINNPQPEVESAVYIDGRGQAVDRTLMTGFSLELENNAEDGVHVDHTGENGDIIFDDWIVRGASDGGALVDTSPNHVFSDFHTTGQAEGFKVENSDSTSIKYTSITEGGDRPNFGVHMQDSRNCFITGSNFRDVENRGIWVENCYHVSITNNILFGSGYGIFLENTSALVNNNDVTESSTYPIERLDTENLIVRNNKGYVLSNYGQATMLDGTDEITIGHGLHEIPEIVNVQGLENASRSYYFYIGDINSENFTVYSRLNMGEDTLLSWKAEAE